MNKLYYGDNLHVLRMHIPDESVDLIYLDPPFNSGRDYNAVFDDADGDGKKTTAQIKAFTDTWTWDDTAARAYEEIVNPGGRIADILRAFKVVLGSSSTLAYLSMMAPRLVELKRVLKPTGSIYLHCDPTASHYLKMLMDAVMGRENFRNEIVWCYRGGGRPGQDFGRKHDILFRYTSSLECTFNADTIRIPYEAQGKHRKDASAWGRHAGGKAYLPNPLGKVPEDWWPMDALNSNDPERLGYPTQKPRALLDRIIQASSNPGDTVLDPFCGCGTCLDSAQALGRNWIGIDITHLAVGVIKKRLTDVHGVEAGKDYKVIGEPADLAGAEALADQDKHQFQAWALGLVGARESAAPAKKGGDKGIDGIKLFPAATPQEEAIKCYISVKAGSVNPGVIRDLRGTMTRDNVPLGLLITLQAPSAGMKTEALAAGFWTPPGLDGMFGEVTEIPCIQIATIEDLLTGKNPVWPAGVTVKAGTFKKGKAAKK